MKKEDPKSVLKLLVLSRLFRLAVSSGSYFEQAPQNFRTGRLIVCKFLANFDGIPAVIFDGIRGCCMEFIEHPQQITESKSICFEKHDVEIMNGEMLLLKGAITEARCI